MFYLGSIAFLIILCCVLALIGRRLADLLPAELNDARSFLAPVLGLAVLTLVATLYGWLLPFRFGPVATITAALVVLAAAFERHPRDWLRSCGPIALVALVGGQTVFFPLLRFGDFDPQSDAMTYLVHGQWLQHHAFAEPVVGIDGNNFMEIWKYQSGGSRMGASFVLAWIQALARLDWSYHAFPVANALPLVSGALAVAGGIRIAVPGSYTGSRVVPLLAACAAATLPGGFAFGASYGFYPMTHGLAFVIAAVVLVAVLTTDGAPARGLGRTAVRALPAAVVLSALAYAYNDMLAPTGLGLALFVVGVILFARPGERRATLVTAIVLAGEVLLIALFEVGRIVRNLTIIRDVTFASGAGGQVGWPVFWPPSGFVAHAFGFRTAGVAGPEWLFGSAAASYALLAVTLAVCTFAAVMLARHRRAAVLHAGLCVLAAYAVAFVFFRYATTPVFDGEIGRTFLQFKLANWAGPLATLWIGIAAAFAARRFPRTPALPLGVVVLCAGIVLGLATHYRFYTKAIGVVTDRHGPLPGSFDSLLALRAALPADRTIDVVFIDRRPLREMIFYILQDRSLATRWDGEGNRFGLPPVGVPVPPETASWQVRMAGAADKADPLGHPQRHMIDRLVVEPAPSR